MRVLLIEDDASETEAIRSALGERYELRATTTLDGALRLLHGRVWQPDVIVADLNLPDSKGAATIEALQDAAVGAPVIISTGVITDTLRRQIDALGAIRISEKGEGFAVLRAVMKHQHALLQAFATGRAELIGEIEKAARRAAETAVSEALSQLVGRLGLPDEEGLRLAVRLARGWETAKARFLGTLATGIASAMLLALGAGLLAMLDGRIRR
jgi:DNA-binding NtrC family response regulator